MFPIIDVLSLPATVDSEYKNELVKYVLGSGGVAIVHVVDKYGKEYQVKRIFGENTYVFDLDGNNLGIDCSSIICNPVYFGQGDLALTKAGYEFELLHKLVKPDENYEIRLTECLSSIKTKIGEWMELESLPTQIEDIQSKIRDINHKLKIFEEHGVAAKLAKQTGYATDLTGDAERIVAASFTDIDLNMNMSLGSIDSIESQRQIVTIMEGGQEAFKRRNEIYSSWGK